MEHIKRRVISFIDCPKKPAVLPSESELTPLNVYLDLTLVKNNSDNCYVLYHNEEELSVGSSEHCHELAKKIKAYTMENLKLFL